MQHRARLTVPIVLGFLLASAPGVRATEFLPTGEPVVGRGVYLGVSRAVRDLPLARESHVASSPVDGPEKRAVPAKVSPADTTLERSAGPASLPGGRNASRSATGGEHAARASVAPKASFTTPTGFAGIQNTDHPGEMIRVPPDTVGDIGPNHYVQMTNVLFEIFDPANGDTLDGPHLISSLWTGFGGVCEAEDQGDPIVVYDQVADRWLLSQFNFTRDGSGGPSGPFSECIAISVTDDPTGSFHLYSFELHDTLLPDYPKIGVWRDGYYLTVNQFDFGPGGEGGFAGGGVAVFERDVMLTGGSPRFVYLDLGPAFGGMLPADVDGPVPPPIDAPAYFAQFDLPGALNDSQIQVFGGHTDWSGAGSFTFTSEGIVDVTSHGLPIDTSVCPVKNGIVQLNCIPQKDTSVKVDALADRLMWRLVYRNFGSHESLLMNHTVDVGGNQAGVRWYEFRDPSNPTFHQGGTYAPGSRHRWMGSMAMDGDGNIALGYSRSGENSYPGIFATGRAKNDPPGEMPISELTLKLGSASQTFSKKRWGDYSSMNIDPEDDCTFWYTNQYYDSASDGAEGLWKTWIGSFKIAGCNGLETGSLSGTITGVPAGGAIVEAGSLRTRTDGAGAYSFPAIPAGTYRVTARAPLTAPVGATRTVTDGGAATANLTLGAPEVLGADFNGDGFGDLAVGVPNDLRGGKDSGAVNIFHGSAAGLIVPGGTKIIHQDTPGVAGVGEPGDNVGVSLATGNFNGDAYDDLAIGADGEGLNGRANAGIVHVVLGSASGLDPSTTQNIHQNAPGIVGVVEQGDRFGWALAAGDFDQDGRDDLAIGVPGENRNKGGVAVIYGGTSGLSTRDQFWTQGSPGVAGSPERGDRFGEALAAGDFNGGGKDDLAIGAPQEGLGGRPDVGAVHVLFGASGAGGLRAAGDQLLHQGKKNVAGTNEAGDRYGAALASGNFNGDGRDDLAIGIPGEGVGGKPAVGAFAVMKGAGWGLSGQGDRWLHRNSTGVAGIGFGFDGFGERLAAGDFDGDGRDDLVVGAPLDRVLGRAKAGSFNAFFGHAGSIITTVGDRVWTQMEIGSSASEPFDLLGVGLSGGDFNGDGLADLAVGVPGESTNVVAGFGIAYALHGSARGLTSHLAALASQIGSIPNQVKDGELFGWAAAG